MRIRRSRLTRDYIQVPNATVRDDRLGHMARGILVELLSRPDGWETTADDMWKASVAAHGTSSPGRRMFRAAFAELKQSGYLTASREVLGGGRHATVLTLTDVPVSGVPHAGTSARPAATNNAAGETDVPHAGTPDEATDVPLSDVPHGGTSKEEDGKKKTEKTKDKDSSPPAQTHAPASSWNEHAATSAAVAAQSLFDDCDDWADPFDTHTNPQQAAAKVDGADQFDNFWAAYPKRKAKTEARKAWIKALKDGATADHVIAAASRFAGERAAKDPQYTPYPATWLARGSYDDEPEPTQGAFLVPINGGAAHYPNTRQLTGTDARVAGWAQLAAELEARGNAQ